MIEGVFCLALGVRGAWMLYPRRGKHCHSSTARTGGLSFNSTQSVLYDRHGSTALLSDGNTDFYF